MATRKALIANVVPVWLRNYRSELLPRDVIAAMNDIIVEAFFHEPTVMLLPIRTHAVALWLMMTPCSTENGCAQLRIRRPRAVYCGPFIS